MGSLRVAESWRRRMTWRLDERIEYVDTVDSFKLHAATTDAIAVARPLRA